MTQSIDRDDKPLDPAQTDVVRRLRRLMVFSSLIMLGGFIVVFGVIGYRLSTVSADRAATEASVRIPKGARVTATAVADGKLIVTLELKGAIEVRLFDLGTLQQSGRLSFEPLP
jgi:hypothetical protein